MSEFLSLLVIPQTLVFVPIVCVAIGVLARLWKRQSALLWGFTTLGFTLVVLPVSYTFYFTLVFLTGKSSTAATAVWESMLRTFLHPTILGSVIAAFVTMLMLTNAKEKDAATSQE